MAARIIGITALLLLVCALVIAGITSMAQTGHNPLSTAPADVQFTLENYDGRKVSLADYAGKIVVMEWTNPNCPVVKRHYKEGTMTTLAAKYADKGVVWLAVNSTSTDTKETCKKWAVEQKLTYPVLDDSAGDTARQFKVKKTPQMFIIKDGKAVYLGAIDDDSKGVKPADQRVNYVVKALDELLAGKNVSTEETRPYGCDVVLKK